MKKIVFISIILITCGATIFLISHYGKKDIAAQVGSLYQPPEQSREELYQDIYISLLMPYIEKEIHAYYSKTFKILPSVAPYTIYIVSAERPDGYRTFLFRLKLKVVPYVGAHNSVGVDNITLTVNASGGVNVERFEHVRSYRLPLQYKTY